jgi:hypothetical protein
MTGRGAGFCAGNDVPGYANPGFGYGRGMGAGARWGGGRGYRHQYWATGQPGWQRFGAAVPWGAGPAFVPPPGAPTAGQQAAALEQQAGWLREQLADLEAHIAGLRGSASEETKSGGE